MVRAVVYVRVDSDNRARRLAAAYIRGLIDSDDPSLFILGDPVFELLFLDVFDAYPVPGDSVRFAFGTTETLPGNQSEYVSLSRHSEQLGEHPAIYVQPDVPNG